MELSWALVVSQLVAFSQIIMIDLAMAGDNVIVVGLATVGLAAAMRRKAIVLGIAAAAILRVIFAVFVVELMKIPGLLLVGGLLLVWVSWKFWTQIRSGAHEEMHKETDETKAPTKKLSQAILEIVAADVSMSLDNVLGVAGAARDHIWILVFGLFLSVMLMGFLASQVATLLSKYKWISYVGLAVIVYVAARMTFDGVIELNHTLGLFPSDPTALTSLTTFLG